MDCIELNWEITHKCNLKCPHCLIGDNKEPFEVQYNEIINFLQSLNFYRNIKIKFTGGEPFCYTNFKSLILYCIENNYNIEIVTNGLLLNDEWLEIIKNNNISLGISVESFKKDTYEIFRGKNNFEKLLKILRKIKNKDINCCLYCTINKLNQDELLNIIETAKDYSFDLHFNDLSLLGNAKTNHKKLEITSNTYNKLKSIVKTVHNEELLKVDDLCWVNKNTFFINNYGNIYHCSEINQKCPNLKLGNIKTFSIKNYINNSAKFEYMNCNYKCSYAVYCSSNVSYIQNIPRTCIFCNQSKIKNLTQLKAAFNDLLKNCGQFCKHCNYPDCMGYIWIIPEERKNLLKKGIELLTVNKNVEFLNFVKDENNISEEISQIHPKCIHRCSNGKCSIQKNKPLTCVMYPVTINSDENGNSFWSLNLDCAFTQHLLQNNKFESFYIKFMTIINSIDKLLYKNITNSFKEMDKLTSYPDGLNNYIILKEV